MRVIKRMRLFTFWAAVVLLSEIWLVLPADAAGAGEGTEVRAPKKIVSIVFDDSSSMYNDGADSWAQANYATQVFAALMNPQDELWITYMSELESRRIDLTEPNTAVKTIQKRKTDWGATPLEAVDVAAQTLDRVRETDPDTQFWLVVMTDGQFSNTGSMFTDIQNACDRLKGKSMSNGSSLNVYYFGIGGSAVKVKADSTNGLEAVSSGNIVGTLNDVANTISGRLKYDDSEIRYIDDSTIEVSSRLPLYSLSAFIQNTKAEVIQVTAENSEGETLLLDHQNVRVSSPKPEDVIGEGSDPYGVKPVDIYGSVSGITYKEQIIPAGKYTVRFSEPVDKGAVVLMYQPSIKLLLTLYKDGREVTDTAEVVQGDNVELCMRLVDPLTGEEIDLGLLPPSTRNEIVEESGGGRDIVTGMSRIVQDISPGAYSFTGQMIIPGMIPVRSNTIFLNVEEYRPRPAIHLTILKKGNLQDEMVYDNTGGIDRLDTLEADDRILVRAEAYDADTGNPIDAGRLHGQEDWNIAYLVNAVLVDSRQADEFREIDVRVGDNRIICDYEISGLTAQETAGFAVKYPQVYAIEVGKINGAFRRSRLRVPEELANAPLLWITRDEDADKDGVGDGNPERLSLNETTGARKLVLGEVAVERKDFGLIVNRIGFLKADMEIIQNRDGSYAVYPTLSGPGGLLKGIFFPYLIETGTYHAKTVLDINKQEQEITADVTGKLSDWLPLLVEILFLWLIWRIFHMIAVKKKFARNSSLELTVYQRTANGKGIELAGQNEMIPLKRYGEHPFSKRPAVVRVRTLGITVEASATGTPCIRTWSVYPQGFWGTSLARAEQFDKIKKEIKEKTKLRKEKMSGEPEMTALSNNPAFFYESGNQMFALIVRKQ